MIPIILMVKRKEIQYSVNFKSFHNALCYCLDSNKVWDGYLTFNRADETRSSFKCQVKNMGSWFHCHQLGSIWKFKCQIKKNLWSFQLLRTRRTWALPKWSKLFRKKIFYQFEQFRGNGILIGEKKQNARDN